MNLRATKTSDTAPRVTPEELVAAIERKGAALHQRDRLLMTEQVELEQSGASPVAAKAAPEAEQRARELLNGFASALPPIEESNGRLHQILVEREAIRIATTALQREELRSRTVAMALAIQETEMEWREIVRARFDAVLALRRANARADKFRDRLARFSTGYGASLRCDPQMGDLWGTPWVGDDGYRFLEWCVAEGFATQKEISC